MKKRDDTVYLRDILDAIYQIEEYLKGISHEAFRQDKMRQDAVVRRLEIIGEASRNLTTEFQAQHQEVPWQEIIGMRNKIVHDYFGVDLQTVWDTVEDDLPPLKKWVLNILEEK
jgi:uncharacterized protein with HEPN domain